MVKKIIIIILLLVSLFLIIFQPMGFEMIDTFAKEMGFFEGHIFGFYCLSTMLLFWVGIPAGWNFARDRDWGLIAILISTYIGMLLSLPIALFQLFRHRD